MRWCAASARRATSSSAGSSTSSRRTCCSSAGSAAADGSPSSAESHGRAWSPHTWSNGVGLVANLHGALGCSDGPWIEVPYDPPAWGPDRRDWLLDRPARDRVRRHDRAPRRPRASGSSSTSTRSSAGASDVGAVTHAARRCCASRATSASRRCELDPPKADEVLVRVAAAGVCHSDLHFVDGVLGDGRWPMVLGHEGAGVVEAGRRRRHACRARRPRRVLLRPVVPRVPYLPGRAAQPLRARGRNSARGNAHGRDVPACARRRDAAAARTRDRLLRRAHGRRRRRARSRCPAELPLWQAALLGCGVVTGFGAVRNVARVRRGESVVVVGLRRRRAAGPRGGEARRGVAASSPSTATPRSSSSRSRAAPTTSSTRRPSTRAVRALRTLTGGGADHAFEVVGRPRDDAARVEGDPARRHGRRRRPRRTRRRRRACPRSSSSRTRASAGRTTGRATRAADLPALARLALDGDLDLAGVVSHLDTLDGRRARRSTGSAAARARVPSSSSTPRPRARRTPPTEASDDHHLRRPAERRRRRRRPRHPRQGVHRRCVRRRGIGRDVRLRQPDHGRGRRAGRRRRHGRRRPRGRRSARGVRVGRLVATRAEEAQARAPEARRADVRARRGARAPRDDRHGQADPRRHERRRPARDGVHRVVRRGDRQGLRRDRARPAPTRTSRSSASRSASSARSCRGTSR